MSIELLMSLPKVNIESKLLGGAKNNKLLEMAGLDCSFKLKDQQGKVLADAQTEGILEALTQLKISDQPWLAVKALWKDDKFASLKTKSIEEWHILNSQSDQILGVCYFDSFKDQLFHFGDWFKSEVKDTSGRVIGQIKGKFRFCRLLPFIKMLFEKRFEIYLGLTE